jgi:hypothetical protein
MWPVNQTWVHLLKKVNVTQDLAMKLQILLGAFSLDLNKKKKKKKKKKEELRAEHQVPEIRGGNE